MKEHAGRLTKDGEILEEVKVVRGLVEKNTTTEKHDEHAVEDKGVEVTEPVLENGKNGKEVENGVKAEAEEAKEAEA